MKTLLVTVRPRRAAFRTLLVVLGASASVFYMTGCADQSRPVDNTAMLPENERISTVPWNKPESWENQGALGQLANDPHFTATH